MECHTGQTDGLNDDGSKLGAGGQTFKGPWGSAVAPNITSHPTAGLGGWSDEEIKRSLTHGVARDGRAFKPPMARAAFFSRMTDADLQAIVTCLRTVPPVG